MTRHPDQRRFAKPARGQVWLLCALAWLGSSRAQADDDAAAAARYEVRLQQATALAADAGKRCAHQPPPARPRCYESIAAAATRLREHAQSERDSPPPAEQ